MMLKRTVTCWLFIVVTICAIACSAKETAVKTGIEVLKEQQFNCLKGKRVALITNPTGVDNALTSTIDLIFKAPDVQLVALFAPEHGVRGDAYAGAHVNQAVDALTGVPVYSLYGKTRKPTAQMLQGIDVVVYDIQDIGSRSFTFIATMGLAMEACAEQGVEFIVLDRPNPLGGEKVEGPLVEPDCITFVSQFPIPYVYGLTCGELAQWLNNEYLKTPCKLHVVAMEGWKRNMDYSATQLMWIAPSPHIPSALTAFFYPLSGIAGDLEPVSNGVGYTLPFQLLAPVNVRLDSYVLAEAMNALNLPGLHFRPISYKPFYGRGQGSTLNGVQVHLTDSKAAVLTEVNFYFLQELHRLAPELILDISLIAKVCGSKKLAEIFSKRYRFEDIKAYWHKDEADFKVNSRKYWLYE